MLVSLALGCGATSGPRSATSDPLLPNSAALPMARRAEIENDLAAGRQALALARARCFVVELRAIAASDDPRGEASRSLVADSLGETADAFDAARASLRELAEGRFDDPERAQRWRECVEAGATWLEREPRVFDPAFWERAVVERRGAAWPAAVVAVFAEIAGLTCDEAWDGAASDGDALAAYFAASVRLERAEDGSAVFGFRFAKEVATAKTLRGVAAVGEARGLARLGRVEEARAILVDVAAGRCAVARSASLGFLGAIELAQDRPERAVTLLRRALELDAATLEFPGRDDATANLALALLATSRAVEGQEWVEVAKARYRDRGDVVGYLQVALNEIGFLTTVGAAASVEPARAEVARVAREGLPVRTERGEDRR